MAVHIFWPDEEDLRLRGFDPVKHVPCLFNGEWVYLREPSTYLIERALLDWAPGTKNNQGSNKIPTKQSLQVYAESLSNFLEWAEMRGVDWKTATYNDHLLRGYQKEMNQGSWSASGASLSPSTINGRVQEACNLLSWAHDRGLRDKFVVPTKVRVVRVGGATSSHGHRTREVQVRVGKVRRHPRTLSLPTDELVRKWLYAVRIRRGATKALMSELILKTAVRREEAASWRLDTLPENPADWKVIGNEVSVTIRFGTKGQDFGEDAGDKIGPERTIGIPLEFAHRLHEYRRGPRLEARSKWVRSASTTAEKRARIARPSPHLFLSESTGQNITAKTLYEAWTGAGQMPFDGWSPHLGRHYWACKTLLNEATKRATLLASGNHNLPIDWITANSMSDIQLLIKPQLGHIDQETTEMYLGWVTRIFAGGEMQLQYSDHLDSIRSDLIDESVSGG